MKICKKQSCCVLVGKQSIHFISTFHLTAALQKSCLKDETSRQERNRTFQNVGRSVGDVASEQIIAEEHSEASGCGRWGKQAYSARRPPERRVELTGPRERRRVSDVREDGRRSESAIHPLCRFLRHPGAQGMRWCPPARGQGSYSLWLTRPLPEAPSQIHGAALPAPWLSAVAWARVVAVTTHPGCSRRHPLLGEGPAALLRPSRGETALVRKRLRRTSWREGPPSGAARPPLLSWSCSSLQPSGNVDLRPGTLLIAAPKRGAP